MLVLARRIEEAVIIGDSVSVKVVSIDTVRGIVRLGIEAPREIPVHREEVYEAIKREQQ